MIISTFIHQILHFILDVCIHVFECFLGLRTCVEVGDNSESSSQTCFLIETRHYVVNLPFINWKTQQCVDIPDAVNKTESESNVYDLKVFADHSVHYIVTKRQLAMPVYVPLLYLFVLGAA